MKILKYIFIFSVIAILAGACEGYIDDITPVNPKADQSIPTVVINFPTEGKIVRSPDELSSIVFEAVAVDDIELKYVTLLLDGTEIVSYTSFMDYRRLVVAYSYSSLNDGDHTLTVNVADLTDKTATTSVNFRKVTVPPYTPLDGEKAYFSFDGMYLDVISGTEPTIVGSPGLAEGKSIDAYAGATDAYLEFPSAGVVGDEFSLCFWYKINAVPDRAGIVSISPPFDGVTQDRTLGFRLFREISGGNQNIGLNIGIGTTEVWMNPFINVPPDQDWMHIAISISTTHVSIYVNGASVNETDIAGKISWTNCSSISIGSGEPNFIYWEHFSDLSLYDEMHFFARAITAAEVQTFYAIK
jgi:hypothetical protein